MKYEQEHRYGTLTFDFGYHLSDVEDRPVQYSRTGAMYRPDYLRFTLRASHMDAGKMPTADELEVHSITLSGQKLKKDGSVGAAMTREVVYDYERYRLPEGVMPLIQYAIKEVQAS
jgi:hypothetical protein